MTDQAIVVVQPGFLAPVIGVQQALEAYQAKKDLIDKIFKEGVDYGTIPGSSKPSLLKAGAEKSTSFFGLHPVMADAEVVNDWTGQDHGGEPFFYYRRTCNLYRGDVLVASVDGSCNSWEKKYRYRWVDESNVPSNVDKSKLKTQGGKISEFSFALDKAETTGKYGKPVEYWERFKTAVANGTARKFMRKTSKGEAEAWEIDGTLYCLPNEDPSDIVNTVLKMADKRALVAATLITTGLSEYFTQDIEDYVPGEFTEVAEPVKVAQKPTTTKQTPGMTLEDACEILDSNGVKYGVIPSKTIAAKLTEMAKDRNPRDEKLEKIEASKMILDARNKKLLPEPTAEQTQLDLAKDLGGEESPAD